MSGEWHRSHIGADAADERMAEDLRVVLECRLNRTELAIAVVVCCAVLLSLAFGLIPLRAS